MIDIKVPFLPGIQIEHAVAELLRNYSKWKGAPVLPPIDTDEIVEKYLDLDLEMANLQELLGISGILGALWIDRKLVRIDESLEETEGRFSFSVAHEIGHWQLHRPLYEVEKITLPLFPTKRAGKPEPAIICRDTGSEGSKKPPAEWQADQFAAMLLMPRLEMVAAVRKTFPEGVPPIDGLNESRENKVLNPRLRLVVDRIKDAGNFSNVSNEAMCYRLLDLNVVEDTKEAQTRLF